MGNDFFFFNFIRFLFCKLVYEFFFFLQLMSVWRREEYLAIVLDVSLGNTFSAEGLNRLFQAARMCMDPNVLARPTMRFVETMVRQAAAYDVVTLPPVLRRDLV